MTFKKISACLFISFLSTVTFAKESQYIIRGLSSQTPEVSITKAGGIFHRKLTYHNALVAKLSEKSLQKLKNKFPGISIEQDIKVSIIDRISGRGNKKRGSIEQPPQVVSWGISKVKASDDVTRSVTKGAGAIVCVVDTGVDKDHPDLIDNIDGGENFVVMKGRVTASKWDDDNNHGTHVSGIIAAADNTIGVVGVAPEAKIFASKVLDSRGSGYTSDVADGVRSCITRGADVINMSLGSSQSSAILASAVADAVSAGITVVAAAGNSYGAAVSYPAAYPNVIAVTAIDINNNLASFSNLGPEVDFTAPGVSVYSTIAGGSYASYSGTSMASPHVAGVEALRVSAGMSTIHADFLSGLSEDEQGQGLVNALKTVTEY